MDDATNLSEHLAVLRRRWKFPVAIMLHGMVAGLALSLPQTPMYAAESRLLLEPTQESVNSTVMSPDEVATQADVVASTAVAQLVIDKLQLTDTPKDLLGSVTVEALDQTRIVTIRALRSSAQEASDIANAFANGYIDFRSEAAVAVEVKSRNALLDELDTVQSTLRTARQDLGTATASGKRDSLKAQIRSLTSREAELTTEIALTGGADPKSPGTPLRTADVPQSPAEPRPVRATMLGGFIGLLLGLILAYARDRIDDRIRDESRLRLVLGSIPILGRIPEDTRDNQTRPAALTAPRSAVTEGFRTLNTNIRFLTAVSEVPTSAEDGAQGNQRRPPGQLLVVTSASPSETKTSVCSNLAITAAAVGLKVLLVDADLRSPTISELFGIETPRGLAHVLAGQSKLERVIIDTGVPNLRLIGAGAVPPNPAELLASPQAHRLWERLRELADMVIVDTAPVLRVADPLEIVRQADAVIFATRHRVTRVHQLQAAIERTRQAGGEVNGVVWSGIPGKAHSYGYGSSEGDELDGSETGSSSRHSSGTGQANGKAAASQQESGKSTGPQRTSATR